MGDWNLGSVHDTVLDMVPDFPTNLSGTRLLEMSDRQREYVENYVGATIGSNSIELKYQDPIWKLTAAQGIETMQLVGGDAKNLKLGDFSIDKGSESNLDVVGRGLKASAKEDLRVLGRKTTWTKSRG